MALIESVTKLQSLLPALKASDAKFAADLIASFHKYGSLTVKQAPWIDKLIVRAETPAFQVVASSPVHVGGFAGVLSLFATAKAHLKFPKIRLSLNGTKLVLSLNGEKSKKPGHVSISGEGVYPNRAFYGSVSPDGVFTPFKAELLGLTALLSELASHPARVAKDHGKLTGNCCFCNKVLGLGKEQRSVLVGFGPDCAEHYGLKAEWLAAADKAEAKASVAGPSDEAIAAIALLDAHHAKTAALKLEGPWLGSANGTTHALLGDYVEQTHPAFAQAFHKEFGTSEAQAQQAYDAAADQAKNDDDKAQGQTAEGNVPYTAALLWDFVEQTPQNPDEAQAELGQEYGSTVAALLTETPKVTCFFCEQQTAQYASLHGYIVCPTCVAQLK